MNAAAIALLDVTVQINRENSLFLLETGLPESVPLHINHY